MFSRLLLGGGVEARLPDLIRFFFARFFNRPLSQTACVLPGKSQNKHDIYNG